MAEGATGKLRGSLPAEVDEDPPKVVRVLLDAMVLGLDLRLVQESQDPLLELTGPLARDDLDQGRLGPRSLRDDVLQRFVDVAPAVVDVVEIELEFQGRPP